MISPLEGTAPAAKLKVGNNILLDAMSQTNDEYESYEKSFAKSVMQYNVDNGTLNLWGFTKIFNRNESAMKEPTHFTWRVPVNNKEFEWDNETLHDKFGNKFVYDKMWQLTSESRKVIGNANLEIVDIIE